MSTPIVRTYGKRSSSSSKAVLKRKPTSELVDDDPPVAGPSTTVDTPKAGGGVPEKRRKLEPSSSFRKDTHAPVIDLTRSTSNTSRPTSPTKLSQRMLGRSKTETSITDDSPSRDTRRTPSLPNINASPKAGLEFSPSKEPQRPSFFSPLRSNPSFTSMGSSSSTSVALNTGTTSIATSRTTVTRTYAGKSRSFLMPLSGFSGDPSHPELSQPEEIEDEFSRESYASLRERWGVDNTSEDDQFYDGITPSRGATPSSATPSPTKAKGRGKLGHSQGTPSKSRLRKSNSPEKRPAPPPLPSNMMNPLKSITELRNKGESRRFLDEVAYLLDGMSISSGSNAGGSKAVSNIGLIRASALELITKLSEPDFSRKAKAADIHGRVYDLLVDAGAGRGTDKVLDTILLTFLVLLAREPAALVELAETYPASYAYSAIPTRPNTPISISRSVSKEKRKSPSTAPDTASRSLVDILFTLLRIHTPNNDDDNPEDGPPSSDPLVLSSSDAYTDAHFKRVGIGKKEKGMIITLHTTLSLLSIPGSKSTTKKRKSLNTPNIVVALLHLLPPSLLPANGWRVNTLVGSLNTVLTRFLSTGSSSATNGSNARPSTKGSSKPQATSSSVDWLNLHIHLHLLDQYLLEKWGLADEPIDEAKEDQVWITMVDRLVKLGEMLVNSGGEDDVNLNINRSGSQCLETLLRVLVTLTHGEEKWAKRVVSESGKHTDGQGGPELLWLTALVKTSGNRLDNVGGPMKKIDVKQTEKTVVDEDVWRRRKPQDDPEDTETKSAGTDAGNSSDDGGATRQQQERQLRAERRGRALDRLCLALALLTNLVQVLDTIGDSMREAGTLEVLAWIYEQQEALSEDVISSEESEGDTQEREQVQADASFLRGHLAVLFGLLMRENEENKEVILQLLPHRGESWRLKSTRLVDHAKRFVSFFDVVQASQHQDGLNEEEQNEKKLAQQVVGFLVELRDSC